MKAEYTCPSVDDVLTSNDADSAFVALKDELISAATLSVYLRKTMTATHAPYAASKTLESIVSDAFDAGLVPAVRSLHNALLPCSVTHAAIHDDAAQRKVTLGSPDA